MSVEPIISDGQSAPLASVLRGTMTADVRARMDAIARLASRAVGSSVGLVSLVEADGQHFAGAVGLPEPWQSTRETPLTHSFCRHVVASQADLLVVDAREHPVLRDNLAIQDLGVIAYAGTPLRSNDGTVIGSVCAIEGRPREWSEADLEALRDASTLAGAELNVTRRTDQRVTPHPEEEVFAALMTLHRLFDEVNRAGEAAAADQRRRLRTLVHEVTTPIAATRMACEDIEDDPRTRAREIVTGVTEALRVLQAHVDVEERPWAGRVRTERVEIGPLLERVRTMMAPLRAAGVELHVRTPTEWHTLETDPLLVGQVLRNLVSNALRSTSSGRVVLAAERSGASVRFTVSDTGSGVAPEDAERIFLDGVSGPSAGRFGLGLPLSRTLMRALGGDVRLVASSPVGSVFEATVGSPASPR